MFIIKFPLNFFQDINECIPDPCQNGGVCTDQVAAYSCNCAGTGYHGTNCTVGEQ